MQTASEKAAYKRGQVDYENGIHKNPYSMARNYDMWRAWSDGWDYAKSFEYF